jgi:hypothetical protein
MISEQGVANPVHLSENQARRARSGVRTLRESLSDMFRLIDPSPADSRFPLVDYDLSEDEVAAIRALSDELSNRIDELSRLLNLEPKRRSARRAIDAAASYAWTVTLGIHPSRFKELGDLDPRLVSSLGNEFDQLAQGFLALARLVEQRRDSSEEASPAEAVPHSGEPGGE